MKMEHLDVAVCAPVRRLTPRYTGTGDHTLIYDILSLIDGIVEREYSALFSSSLFHYLCLTLRLLPLLHYES